MQPKIMVGRIEMFALISTVSMHSVRVNHEFELLAMLLQLIDKMHGTLEMDIVVTCTMSNLEHD